MIKCGFQKSLTYLTRHEIKLHQLKRMRKKKKGKSENGDKDFEEEKKRGQGGGGKRGKGKRKKVKDAGSKSWRPTKVLDNLTLNLNW